MVGVSGQRCVSIDSVLRDPSPDPVYRHALANWNAFVNALVPVAIERADDTLPVLPAKDLVHRLA
jgi:hypothetical protein